MKKLAENWLFPGFAVVCWALAILALGAAFSSMLGTGRSDAERHRLRPVEHRAEPACSAGFYIHTRTDEGYFCAPGQKP